MTIRVHSTPLALSASLDGATALPPTTILGMPLAQYNLASHGSTTNERMNLYCNELEQEYQLEYPTIGSTKDHFSRLTALPTQKYRDYIIQQTDKHRGRLIQTKKTRFQHVDDGRRNRMANRTQNFLSPA